jgi:hypothetical protein
VAEPLYPGPEAVPSNLFVLYMKNPFHAQEPKQNPNPHEVFDPLGILLSKGKTNQIVPDSIGNR